MSRISSLLAQVAMRWLAICMLALSPALHAQHSTAWGLTADSSTQERDAVIDTAARVISADPVRLDGMLMRMGFQPGEIEGWKGFSSKKKIETAYRWAAAVDERNGTLLLYKIAQGVERRYESLGFDPFFAASKSRLDATLEGTAKSIDKTTVQFARPNISQSVAALPDDVRYMVDKLSQYVNNEGQFGRPAVARRVFGLDGKALDTVLDKSDSREFLRAAASLAPLPPPVHVRLNAMMREILNAFSDSAPHDASLAKAAAVIEKRYGKPSETQTAALYVDDRGMLRSAAEDASSNEQPAAASKNIEPSTPSSGGGGGSPERLKAASHAHASFERQVFNAHTPKTYAKVMARAGGPGGVVAGAPVTSKLSGKIKAIALETQPGTPCGTLGKPLAKATLVVTLDMGRTVRSRPHDCDTVEAARRVVFGGPEIKAWQPGEAVVLATIDSGGLSKVFPYYLPSNGGLLSMGERNRMILHPALVDLDIGRSMALLDLWPSAPIALFDATGQALEIQAWLKQIRNHRASTWKWTEHPSTVSVSADGMLRVSTKNDESLIRMRLFTEDEHDKEMNCLNSATDRSTCVNSVAGKEAGVDAPSMSKAARHLVKRHHDFRKFQSLLEVLAVMRLGKEQGIRATDNVISLAAHRIKTPSAVIVAMNGSYLAFESSDDDFLAQCRSFGKALDASLTLLKSPQPDYIRVEQRLIFRNVVTNLVSQNLALLDGDKPITMRCI